jgi:hypothetical protein
MGSSRRRPGRTPGSRRSLAPAAVALGCAVLLAGCSGGGLQDAVVQAVEQAASSVATARLAAELEDAGRLTPAAASTSLDDALKELGTARTNVLELSATVQDEREVRDEALAVMDECVAAVAATADAVSSHDGRPPLDEGRAALQSAAQQLADLERELGSR